MAAASMEEFIESPMLLLQCGMALAVPAVLTAIVNLGCGKKRDQPVRPGAKKDLSKSKPGVASSKSLKSKRSTKSAASTKSGKKGGKSSKDVKSKRSSKSIDKSGKSGKKSKKSSKSSKGSKSSKSKKSKRDVNLQKTGPPSSQRSDALKQPGSARTAIEADKRSAKLAASQAAAAVSNSVRSAATQLSTSQKQPPSCTIVDGNGNNIGTTALVAVGGDSTRELKMEPAELRWSSTGGMQKISLLNQSNERQAIKVKCSDNTVYRVNPVYAIVEPGQTLNVDVMRQNGSNKVDKIVFVTTRAGLEENPKNLFKPGTQSSMMVLPLLATNAAASNNQPAALTAAI